MEGQGWHLEPPTVGSRSMLSWAPLLCSYEAYGAATVWPAHSSGPSWCQLCCAASGALLLRCPKRVGLLPCVAAVHGANCAVCGVWSPLAAKSSEHTKRRGAPLHGIAL